MYAEVLIEYNSKAIDKTFTYLIPNSLKAKIKKGMKVKVPFANKIINGFKTVEKSASAFSDTDLGATEMTNTKKEKSRKNVR